MSVLLQASVVSFKRTEGATRFVGKLRPTDQGACSEHTDAGRHEIVQGRAPIHRGLDVAGELAAVHVCETTVEARA